MIIIRVPFAEAMLQCNHQPVIDVDVRPNGIVTECTLILDDISPFDFIG